MNKENRFVFSSPEKKRKYLDQIIAYFQDELDQEIGLIATEELLNFFLDKIGEDIYLKAVSDCRKIIEEKINDLDFELDIIKPKTII